MSRHFHEQLEKLRHRLMEMGFLVQDAIHMAIEALLERNPERVKTVFEKENEINRLEVEIDTKGHELMALGQPVAADLRMVTAILKINTDLERLGDHAVNIAERAQALAEEPRVETNLQLKEMTLAVQKMLQNAVQAFLSGDTELALAVLKSDDVVDRYNDALWEKIQKLMQEDPLVVSSGMKLVRIGHDLERIGDLANNIAEDTLYMKQGKEVRHRFT